MEKEEAMTEVFWSDDDQVVNGGMVLQVRIDLYPGAKSMVSLLLRVLESSLHRWRGSDAYGYLAI